MELVTYICPICGESNDESDECEHCNDLIAHDSSERDKTIDSEESSEQEILRIYPIWLKYGWPLLWGVLLTPVLGIGLIILGKTIFQRYSKKCIITDRKVILREGVFSNFQDIIPLKNIRTLRIEQTAMERMLNVGTVVLSIPGGAKGGIRIEKIARPAEVVDTINSHK